MKHSPEVSGFDLSDLFNELFTAKADTINSFLDLEKLLLEYFEAAARKAADCEHLLYPTSDGTNVAVNLATSIQQMQDDEVPLPIIARVSTAATAAFWQRLRELRCHVRQGGSA